MRKSYYLTNFTLFNVIAVNQVPARLFGGQEAHVLGMYILFSNFILQAYQSYTYPYGVFLS